LSEQVYGSAAAWWAQAQERLSNPGPKRVEISIAAKDVTSEVVENHGGGNICGWTCDYEGNYSGGGITAIHRARLAVNKMATALGWSLVEDNAESQVFERSADVELPLSWRCHIQSDESGLILLKECDESGLPK